MPSILNPYINFKGEAKEAMSFYQTVFGGDLTTSTFGEGGMSQGPDDADLIMHAQLTTPSGYTLMGSDTPAYMEYRPGTNFSVSLSGPSGDEGELRGYWDKLSDGATVGAPLEKAPWGDTFGMLTDRFGVTWLVNIAGEAAPQA